MRNQCAEHSQEDLSLLAAGCLSEQEEASLLEHVKGCAECQHELDEFNRLCDWLSRARCNEDSLSERVLSNSLSRIANEKITSIETNVVDKRHTIRPRHKAEIGKHWVSMAVIFLIGLCVGVALQRAMPTQDTAEVSETNAKGENTTESQSIKSDFNNEVLRAEEVLLCNWDVNEIEWMRFGLSDISPATSVDSTLVPVWHSDGSQRLIKRKDAYEVIGVSSKNDSEDQAIPLQDN